MVKAAAAAAAVAPSSSSNEGKDEEEEAVAAAKEAALLKLEKHWFAEARKGNILSIKDMREYCLANKILPCPPQKEMARMRFKFKYAGLHARWKKPAAYVTSAIDRLGQIFLDVAEFQKDLRVANKNRYILLVGVDMLSQRIECKTFANKKQESWEEGIRQFVTELFPAAATLIVDRDVAISSRKFQERIYNLYKVDFCHLRSRSKSFAAERAIRTLKSLLSQSLALNDKGDNNWLKHLPSVLASLNNRFCRNTNIRRIDVNKDNELQVLAQVFGVKDFSPILNTKVLGNFSTEMYKAVGFKHKPGDKVQISRDANYRVKIDAFTKKSVEGNYTKRVYTVDYGLLKSSNRHYFVHCYKLKSYPELVYSSEVIPALFPEPPDAPDEDELDRLKKEAKRKRKREPWR